VFLFLSEITGVTTKTTNLAKGQGGYFNTQAENTTDFNSIFTDDMDRQSFDNVNPVIKQNDKYKIYISSYLMKNRICSNNIISI
jgi:hypothetical protein